MRRALSSGIVTCREFYLRGFWLRGGLNCPARFRGGASVCYLRCQNVTFTVFISKGLNLRATVLPFTSSCSSFSSSRLQTYTLFGTRSNVYTQSVVLFQVSYARMTVSLLSSAFLSLDYYVVFIGAHERVVAVRRLAADAVERQVE